MPLLRQALYAQNINLYLAPTADGRDAWLSLLRTIGIEGRCFVMSSNMAVRPLSNNIDNTTTSSITADQKQQQQHHKVGGSRDFTSQTMRPPAEAPVGNRLTKQRTSSTITEEGNEIILPKSGNPAQNDDGNDNNTDEHTEQAFDEATVGTTETARGSGGEWVSRGGSCIVSPFGDVLAGPQWEDDEELIYADVDFRDCLKGRLDLDTAGSYSRNDAFKLTVEGLDLDPLPY